MFGEDVASFLSSAKGLNCYKCFPQLEESNKTLTKDAENLSKEKAELNEKLQTQEQGTVHLSTVGSYFLITFLC